MQYSYTAKSGQGVVTTGTLSADTAAQVYQELRQQGLFVISLTENSQAFLARQTTRAIRGRGKISKRDLLNLTSQLAIMIDAGLDFAGSLESLVRQCSNPALKSRLTKLHADVMAGKSISVAMGQHTDIFGAAYVASIAAAEASGRMTVVLKRLAILLRNDVRLRATLVGLLAYPIVLASVAFAVTLGLMFFVLPQFSEVFGQFDMPLPMLTQILLDVSSFLRGNIILCLATVAISGSASVAWFRSVGGRKMRDRLFLKTRLFRGVTQALNTGRSFRLLGLMVDSGVPLLDSLKLVRMSLTNSYYQELFDSFQREVINGRGLSAALVGVELVPASAIEMIRTAERTGTLGTVTQTMGEFYEEEAETRLRHLITLLEPAIIVVMGLMVAMIVLAVMLPIFDFSTMGQ